MSYDGNDIYELWLALGSLNYTESHDTEEEATNQYYHTIAYNL